MIFYTEFITLPLVKFPKLFKKNSLKFFNLFFVAAFIKFAQFIDFVMVAATQTLARL